MLDPYPRLLKRPSQLHGREGSSHARLGSLSPRRLNETGLYTRPASIYHRLASTAPTVCKIHMPYCSFTLAGVWLMALVGATVVY